MPDQPGEQPPLRVAEEAQPVIKPAVPDSLPAADGGESPSHSQSGLSRSRLRAAIWSVYRSPRVEIAPATPVSTEEATPEEPTILPEEELLPGKPLEVIEEYSIPAPPEVVPEPEIPLGSSRKRIRKVKSFRRSGEAEIPPAETLETAAASEDLMAASEATTEPATEPVGTEQPGAQPIEQLVDALEDTDANPALAEELTLSTTDLETFAHVDDHLADLADSTKTPHETELERAARAQGLVTKARLEARQGHLETARKLLGQAITEDPNNAEAWTWLGGLLAEVNLERAKVCLTRAVELDDSNERTKRGLAEVNRKLEEQARQQEEETANRAIVLARPEIKIGLEEVIDRQRRSGIEPDPENIPLGGARFGPAIESGELKPFEYGKPKLGKVPVAIGLIILVAIIVALIWLGPLHGISDTSNTTVVAGSNLPGGQVQTQVAAASVAQGNTAGSDAAFSLKIRLEIDRYNRFFLTARDLRSQIQANKITWDKYIEASKQLQAEIKAEKKPLDSLSVEATPKLIQFYRELQTIATITGTAMDFTVSGIHNTSPEDLEEGNRQFNDAARRLTDLLGLLNQQMPLTAATPDSNLTTPGPTQSVQPSGATSPGNTPIGTVVLESRVEPDQNDLTPGPR